MNKAKMIASDEEFGEKIPPLWMLEATVKAELSKIYERHHRDRSGRSKEFKLRDSGNHQKQHTVLITDSKMWQKKSVFGKVRPAIKSHLKSFNRLSLLHTMLAKVLQGKFMKNGPSKMFRQIHKRWPLKMAKIDKRYGSLVHDCITSYCGDTTNKRMCIVDNCNN